jgi:tetratricopeptide (TPR) repeat protein
MKMLKIDSSHIVAQSRKSACLCVDSIETIGVETKEIRANIAKCIENEVVSYQLSMKLFASLTGDEKDKKIIAINTDINTQEYKKYYFELEKWLADSCDAVREKMMVEDTQNEHSVSKNKEALEEYSKGIKYLNDKNFKKALPFFEKCVKIDPKFAFAWDNIGVCNRRLENYDAAIKAYKKSLALDPKGMMPLHNLPVVYELKKDYDNAILHFKNINKLLPDDPEASYGLGRIYTHHKMDMETGLDYFCQAYNIYVNLNSPYRTDAEKNINYIYSKLKAEGKEEIFMRILKQNKISPN